MLSFLFICESKIRHSNKPCIMFSCKTLNDLDSELKRIHSSSSNLDYIVVDVKPLQGRKL